MTRAETPARGRGPARRRTVTAVLAAALSLPLLAGPALAAEGSIDHVQSRAGSLQVLYSLPDTGSDRPDPASVSVTLDGTPLPATATLASDDHRIRRTTVLAIDVSKSMARGGKFRAAKRAARVFLDSIPDDVYVGVVTFADTVRVPQEPTLDRSAAKRVVGGLTLSLNTNLYRGVARAVDVLGSTGQRSVLVLSDGRDTSRTPLADVTAGIRASKVGVDVVALAQNAREKRLIRPLSDAGGGEVISADDPDQLSRVFSEQARILSRELLVAVTPPPDLKASEGTLSVSVDAGGTSYSDSAFVPIRHAAGAATAEATPSAETLRPAPTGWQLPRAWMLAGIAAIGIAIVVLATSLVGGLGRREQSLENRIAVYTGRSAGARKPAPAPQGMTAQAVDLASKALANNRGAEVRLASRLDAAAVALKPAEWLLLHAAIALGATATVFMLTGENPLLTLLGLVGGLLGPWLYLGHRKSRRLKAFNAQLAGTLQLMAGSLQAGLSLSQGMDTIVREGADPVAGEFRRALVETRLGVPVEDALDAVADRMTSEDFRWTVMAVRIQREVGGNLAELMLNVAATLRERDYLRRQVKSLSAEGRFSAYILLAMPPGVLLFEATSNPTYLEPLISTSMGWVLLAGMGLLMGTGAFMMMRMIKLEV